MSLEKSKVVVSGNEVYVKVFNRYYKATAIFQNVDANTNINNVNEYLESHQWQGVVASFSNDTCVIIADNEDTGALELDIE